MSSSARRRARARFIALVHLGALALAAGCGDESGCDDFNPQSQPVDVGSSHPIEVEFVDGGWSFLDFAGRYWDTTDAEPELLGAGTVTLNGEATLDEAFFLEDGFMMSGSTTVRFEGIDGVFVFDQLPGCE
ncbi:MAG: hypothetical protein ACE37B_16335 [Ilumatobacter sp.]|uniref:hypothetical protein n=1 Tax=Ilumatobacter sp. TaxID=1967498 RepID=UPI0039190A6B